VETLILVRHALSRSNRAELASSAVPGEGLADEGREQARRLHELLAEEPIDLGVATDFSRSQETLELALAGREIPRLIVPELNEIRFGSFAEGPLAEYRAWAASELPDRPAPGDGESRAAAALRFARGLHVLHARPERTIVAVTHALLVRYVLDAARGLVPASLMLEPVVHAYPYRLEGAQVQESARVLEKWGRAPRFRA
jgi:broad specificity phosphatase PhoE